jgi:hypothetical protein
MPKWEYCLLTGVFISPGDNVLACQNSRLYGITSKGLELITDFRTRPKGIDERMIVAQTIFQLGNDGWELAGIGGTAGMMFKRPKA